MSHAHGQPEDDLSCQLTFMVIAYLAFPTIIIGSMVLYYFAASSGFLFSVIVIGAWVALRSFPTVITRWFGKPIPTDKPYRHVLRLYFMLIITLVPYPITFNSLYHTWGHSPKSHCMNIALTKTSNLYFTTTTFTTTGFGDIHAVSTSCQATVTVQMFSGFVVISIIIATLISRLLQLLAVIT